jgi:hypothetical protein
MLYSLNNRGHQARAAGTPPTLGNGKLIGNAAADWLSGARRLHAVLGAPIYLALRLYVSQDFCFLSIELALSY